MSNPQFRIADGKAAWTVRLDAPAGFQVVDHSNDFRLFHFPTAALLSWVLKLSDAANESLVVHHVFDVSDAASKAYLDLVAKTGRLQLSAEGFEREISVGSAKLLRLLNQAVAYNGRLSATNGAEAVRAYLEHFTPAFKDGGAEAAWSAVEKQIGLFASAKPAIAPSSGSSGADLGAESQTTRTKKPAAAAESETGLHGGEFEPLLHAARPDLYRHNAFRIAELPVHAQGRDLDRRQKLIDMAAQTGAAVPPGPWRALPPEGGVDGEKLREAMSRLRDPLQRILDELFWFWPAEAGGAADPAVAPLAEGKVRPAFEAWKKQGLQGDPSGTATHNVAVLCHAAALELEDPAAAKALKDVTAAEAPGFWDLAYKSWKLLLNTDAFWSRLEKRIEEIGDPRLPTSAARRIRRTLPLALLTISARLAAQAAERGDAEAAGRHRRSMESSGLDAALVDRALREAVDPLRDRIEVLCADAERAYLEDPEKGGEAALGLLEKSAPVLAGIDRLFAKGNPAREAAHDGVAARARQAIVQYGNATSINQKVLDLLTKVLAVAEGEAARQTLEADQATAKRLMEEAKADAVYATCWFCKGGTIDVPSSATVEMHGNVTREWAPGGTRVKWTTNTLKVPRCTRCKAAHDKTTRVSGNFALAGVVLGIIGVLLVFFSAGGPRKGGDVVGLGCGGLVACAILAAIFGGIGGIVGRMMAPSGVKAESTKTSFPSILEAQKQGWALGAKPAGVN